MLVRKIIIINATLLAFLAITIWLCVHIGATEELSSTEIDKILFEMLSGKPVPETPAGTIVMELRLPRILMAALVGAALSLAGAAFQGLLRNPLADPYIVGTSAGAAVGGVFAIIFNVRMSFLGISSVAILAFTGAIAAMYLIYQLSNVGGKIPTDTFLLAGVVVGSFLWALVSFLLTLADKSLHEVVFWLMGSTQCATYTQIIMLAVYLAIGFAGLMFYSHHLNLITMGDETAAHLGVDVEKVKILIIVFASLITAAAVSVAGLIGFVGLMIPHVVRILLGADHRIMFPASLLAGAIFLAFTDTAARSLLSPREVPVGVLTAVMGAPFFLYLLRKTHSKM